MDYMPCLFAFEVSDGALWGVILSVGGAVYAGIKAIWYYWTKREKDKATRYKEVLDAKDETNKVKDTELRDLEKQYAAKVEELLMLTLDKVEGAGEKQADKLGALIERATAVMAEFNTTVKQLDLKEN